MCALTVTKLAAQDRHLRHHLDTPTASVRLALGPEDDVTLTHVRSVRLIANSAMGGRLL